MFIADTVYLDSTGAALYPQILLDNFYKDLSSHVYGNPHSRSSSSQQSTDAIEQVRNRILALFNTTQEQYSIIFTSGATSALQIIADNFDWKSSSMANDNDAHNDQSCFCFLEENHTSVVGIREVAASHGAHICCVNSKNIAAIQEKSNNLKHLISNTKNDVVIEKSSGPADTFTLNLFAYPAMCNFSGRKYQLEWISAIKDGTLFPCQKHCCGANWFVLLDAASFVSSSRLDLNLYPADFIPLSFYKIFGFPTGLGALLVKNTSGSILKKSYYGGGTVLATITSDTFHLLKPAISER